jgi:pentalenene synthase
MGLLTNPEELRQHDRYDMPLFACLSYPDAVGPELDLISDWVCWWAVWNDLTDDPDFLNNPHEANRFFSSLAAVVASPDAITDSVSPAQPDSSIAAFVDAFVDVWQRWCHGMSPTFIARTAKNWVNWFNSYITENHNRCNAVTLDVRGYLELRDVTGAVVLELDAAERVGLYEVPSDLLASRLIHDMRQITIRVISVTQDVQSLPKEEKAGDQHNLVLVLEREQPLTREQALREVHTMIRGWTDAFLAHEAAVPRLLDRLALPLTERWPVYKHVADMRTLMKGGVDFCTASGRYAQPHTDTPAHPRRS